MRERKRKNEWQLLERFTQWEEEAAAIEVLWGVTIQLMPSVSRFVNRAHIARWIDKSGQWISINHTDWRVCK